MSGRHFTTEPDGKVELKVTPTGPGAAKPRTVMEALQASVNKHPQRAALCVKRDNQWQQWTYEQYYADCLTAAKSFIHLGVDEFHAVGILGFNSPEWLIANLGAIFCGGFAAGIYTTNKAEACHYVAEHARVQVMVVENDDQLQKILSVKDRLPMLKAIVQYLGEPTKEAKAAGVMSWAEFMCAGAKVPDYEVKSRMDKQTPQNCCTLIYTSGTTGTPKAVMISHDNVTWTAQLAVNFLRMDPTKENHLISFLPLSHIAAQMVDIHTPICIAGTTWFAQPDALKGSLITTLQEVRPTVFLGVPRVWTKIMEKMKEKGAQTKGAKRKIATWAKAKGAKAGVGLQDGSGKKPANFWVANKLVFSKIKKALGLDRCHVMATAAAPISRDTLEYFLSLNMPIYEVYGMSECSGPQTANGPDGYEIGTCGPPIEGVEQMIFEPDADGNGEICFRGRHIFMGYLFNEAKTKDAIDADGWLHSGDIGKLNEKGHLIITGRIKELLITEGGENVAPVPIEEHIKSATPLLSNCMLIGDKRKFLSMIVTLKCEVDLETGIPKDELNPEALALMTELGSSATTVTAARTDEKVIAHIEAGREAANKQAVSRAQRVQKFTILASDFSVPGGELGPTLKLKRPVVTKKYADEIEAMYS